MIHILNISYNKIAPGRPAIRTQRPKRYNLRRVPPKRTSRTSDAMTEPLPEQENCQQQGAICWRMKNGELQVLLVTSRDTGRWVIPKGWPIAGKTIAESALQECWEEAGVVGDLDSAELGAYNYRKRRPRRGDLNCTVSVFSIRVDRLEDDFPERDQRRRKWFRPAKAARKVNEPELGSLLNHLAIAPQEILPGCASDEEGEEPQAMQAQATVSA